MLAADGGHRAVRVILSPELMLQRFQPQCFRKYFAQSALAAAVPQSRAQIQFPVMAQAGADFSVRRQAHLVALLAKSQVRQGAYETDHRAGLFQ
jgi:hypothetical protein